jgi:hypothetical protein
MTMMLRFQGPDGEMYRIDPLFHVRFVFPEILSNLVELTQADSDDAYQNVLKLFNIEFADLVEGLKCIVKLPLACLDTEQTTAKDALTATGFDRLDAKVQSALLYLLGQKFLASAWYVVRDCTEVGAKPSDLSSSEASNLLLLEKVKG